MCGICGLGFADGLRVPDRGTLAVMAGSLQHRGPDSGGYFEAPGAGFGFRRLSIIDLEQETSRSRVKTQRSQ